MHAQQVHPLLDALLVETPINCHLHMQGDCFAVLFHVPWPINSYNQVGMGDEKVCRTKSATQHFDIHLEGDARLQQCTACNQLQGGVSHLRTDFAVYAGWVFAHQCFGGEF
jgi:hypothetical protein